MSNHQIELKLDLLINLIETLPQRMMAEINKKDDHERILSARIQADIDFDFQHAREINKMMYGIPTDNEIYNKNSGIQSMETDEN